MVTHSFSCSELFSICDVTKGPIFLFFRHLAGHFAGRRRCCLEICSGFGGKLSAQRCPQRSRMKNNDAPNIRTLKILLVLLPSHRLSAGLPFLFLLLPPILLPLWLGEVNRATSSWLPNMKRFPKVQDSSLISSQALRLPASPALLRLSLSIHLPLPALSPAAHLSTSFTSNTAGPWHPC